MKPIRILHLFHSSAFVALDLERATASETENASYFLVYDKPYTGKYAESVKSVYPFSTEFFSIINEAENFDYLFVYNLTYAKAFIANRISKRVKVVWRFYGVELYGSPFLKWQLFSDETKMAAGFNLQYHLRKSRIFYFDYLKYSLKGKLHPHQEIKKAIKRVNFFAWFDRGEYDFLQTHCNIKLPEFIAYPHIDNIHKTDIATPKHNAIMVGNSCVPEANHIPVLKIISNAGFKGKVVLPLSYGGNKIYSRNLTQYISSLHLQTHVLDGFLPYEEYISLTTGSAAAVFNSFRQMAQQNILAMLLNGVKVYLNNRNPTFHMLQRKGFLVFDLETQLAEDIGQKNLELSDADKQHNRKMFAAMSAPERKQDFIHALVAGVGASG